LGLSCHSTEKRPTLILPELTSEPLDVMQITCDNGVFKNGEVAVNVEKVTCDTYFDPEIEIHKPTSDSETPCSKLVADGRKSSEVEDNGLKRVSIGWKFKGQHQTQISLCIDDQRYGTMWTKHVIQPSNEFRDKGNRPSFKCDTKSKYRFFGGASSKRLNKLYTKKNQLKSIGDQLGVTFANEIISVGSRSTNYLAKGHLTPDAAMVYDFEQKATYFFINVAPQFQAFNNGNWKYLEARARELAVKSGRKLTVYQGTQDILAYDDASGKKHDLYIDYEGTAIPVPLVFWKVIYDEEANKGVGFIGLNDVFADEHTNFLCTNVCEDLKAWIGDGWMDDMRYKEYVKGRMACCELGDFSNKIDDTPDLTDGNANWPGLLI